MYYLIQCDDDGVIHGIEVDDVQVNFGTWFEPALGVTLGRVVIGLTGQQVNNIKAWWKEPE